MYTAFLRASSSCPFWGFWLGCWPRCPRGRPYCYQLVGAGGGRERNAVFATTALGYSHLLLCCIILHKLRPRPGEGPSRRTHMEGRGQRGAFCGGRLGKGKRLARLARQASNVRGAVLASTFRQKCFCILLFFFINKYACFPHVHATAGRCVSHAIFRRKPHLL